MRQGCIHIARCSHIKTNGTLCGSPALRQGRFCFFHQWQGQRIALKSELPLEPFTLPVLEDAESIQVALMQVMRLIVTGQIHAKTAGLLLYAFQTASRNVRQIPAHPRRAETVVIEPDAVDNNCVGGNVWHPSQFKPITSPTITAPATIGQNLLTSETWEGKWGHAQNSTARFTIMKTTAGNLA